MGIGFANYLDAKFPLDNRSLNRAVNAALIHNRRAMSTSSGLPSSSIEMSAGSSAIPHFGQVPGPIWRTSGCIGQV